MILNKIFLISNLLWILYAILLGRDYKWLGLVIQMFNMVPAQTCLNDPSI